MQPQISYCTSTDGVRLAYAVFGEGRPCINVGYWSWNTTLEWEHPAVVTYCEKLGEGRMLVQYDRRGVGSSQRDVDDVSLQAHVSDLAAIADHLELERFDLAGGVDATAVMVAFAAQYPERVSRLFLWSPFAQGERNATPETARGIVDLALSNWSLARRALADVCMPSGPKETQRWYAKMLRESLSPEMAAKNLGFHMGVDVREYLPLVKAPTLIFHRRDCLAVPLSEAREAAALIPDSRFFVLEGDMIHAYFGDASHVNLIADFLDGLEITVPDQEAPQKTGMIGKIVSHYKIVDKLGEGGMAVVYKARDTRLERTVALKFLSPYSLGTEDEKIRFSREAKTAAALDHPNVCSIYDIGESEGRTFIAMAYIEGESIEEKIRSGPLATDEALDLTIQIAEGLQEAHDKGIVHRDIKPANIMVDKRGRAKILDFGLAKLAEHSRLTKTATIMGTVAYMSPEQAGGETDTDHSVDIWALGAVLYEMVTGSLPFDAPSEAALLHKIIYDDLPEVQTLNPNVPANLIEIISKAMAKRKVDRYGSVDELLEDLGSYQAQTPGPARRRTPRAGTKPVTINKERDDVDALLAKLQDFKVDEAGRPARRKKRFRFALHRRPPIRGHEPAKGPGIRV